MPRLENWGVIMYPSFEENPYLAPECRRTVLCGNIFDDDRFADNTYVSTSSLISLSVKDNKAKTRNTLYELGKPNEDFIAYIDDSGYKLEDYEME